MGLAKPEGYAGLANAYLMLGEYEVLPPVEAYPKARDAAARVLQIDETLAEAHLVMGGVKRDFDRDFLGAETEFRRGIELSPSSATGHRKHSFLLPCFCCHPIANHGDFFNTYRRLRSLGLHAVTEATPTIVRRKAPQSRLELRATAVCQLCSGMKISAISPSF